MCRCHAYTDWRFEGNRCKRKKGEGDSSGGVIRPFPLRYRQNGRRAFSAHSRPFVPIRAPVQRAPGSEPKSRVAFSTGRNGRVWLRLAIRTASRNVHRVWPGLAGRAFNATREIPRVSKQSGRIICISFFLVSVYIFRPFGFVEFRTRRAYPSPADPINRAPLYGKPKKTAPR